MSNMITDAPRLGEMQTMLFQGVQEIVGNLELEKCLQTVSLKTEDIFFHSLLVGPSKWTQICEALTNAYGVMGCHGLILRTGRIFFKDLLREFGEEIGISDLPFRMLPKPKRICSGIIELASYFSELLKFHWSLSEDEKEWVFEMANFSWWEERGENQLIIVYFVIGMFQEFLAWISGGKVYPIRPVFDEISKTWQIAISKQYIS